MEGSRGVADREQVQAPTSHSRAAGARPGGSLASQGRVAAGKKGWMGVRDEAIAKALGWFSIGLGLTELVAPPRFASFIGVQERTNLIRGLGLREIASGIGILAQPDRAGWLWSRAAGDAMDLSLLGAACLAPIAPE